MDSSEIDDEREALAGTERNAADCAEKAWQHVRYLCEVIGSRPAGSPAEAAAREALAGRLRAWGYDVIEQPAPYAPLPRFFLLFPFTGVLLIAAAWLLTAAPILALLLPFWLYLLPAVSRACVNRRPCTCTSANLSARMPVVEPYAPRLILSAHIDSARASPFRRGILLRLKYATMFAVQRSAIALAVFAVPLLLGIPLPAWLLHLLGAAGTLAGGWLIVTQVADQCFHAGRYTPGAHDNASGVGVLLALAERLAADAPPYLSGLEFLFSGAEETGLHGARARAEALAGVQPPPAVLCLDMVGAGDDLCLVGADGTWGKLHTDAHLNALLRGADTQLKTIWYTLRSGDFAAFLRAGLPACALQSSGSMPAEYAYHTLNDRVDLIQKDTLARTAAAVLSFTQLYFAGDAAAAFPVEIRHRPVK